MHGKRVKGLTSAALETLLNYDYPGNIRELQNLIERGVICAVENELVDWGHIFRQGETLARQTFILGDRGRLRASEKGRGEQNETDISYAASGRPLEEIEREICRAAFERCQGNVARAARQLGMTRPTLEYRLRKWGIIRPKPVQAGGKPAPAGANGAGA
jgi:two-component system, NtrC family, response regulator HydG